MSRPSSPEELTRIRTVAATVAVRAGELALSHLHRGVATEQKGPADLVSDADREVEAFIAEALIRAFPDHAVVGEEGLRHAVDEDRPTWYVDPIDGTTNFLKGLSDWGVSLGLVDPGDQPLVGVVAMPLRGELFSAAAGLGATRNGVPIACSATTRLDRTLVCYALPRGRATAWGGAGESLDGLLRVARHTLGTRMQGCAVADLSAVATGTIDAMWSGGMSVWDVAAGLLLAIEAGAMVTDPNGDLVKTVETAFLASPPGVHEELRALLVGPA